MSEQNRDSVERLKSRLYSRDGKVDTGDDRTPLSSSASSAPVAWDDVRPPPSSQPEVPAPMLSSLNLHQPLPMTRRPHRSLAARFLLGSFLFFVLASLAAAYMFFGGANIISPQNIDMEIVAPSLIDGGKAATVEVLIRNRNQTPLENVDLIIDYPDGARAPDDSTRELTHERQSIGTIGPGDQVKRGVTAVFYGSEGVEQKISMKLQYSVAGSNAIFEKDAETAFTIGSSPVSFTVSAPKETISGEQFAIEVEVRSNAIAPVADVAVQIQYPFGFSFVRSEPQADVGGTMWRLGTMEPGAIKKIRIIGVIEGQDGDERIFRFLAGSNAEPTDTSIKVPFLVVPQTLTINRPFITGTISVAGKTGKNITVGPNQALQGTVTWQNNLSDSVSNIELSLSFAGPALDKNSISASNGFYQSSNASLIWTKEKEPSLASAEPGGGGTVEFNFGTLPTGADGVLITNPTIALVLTVRGVRQNGGGAPEQVSSAATAQVTLSSVPSLTAEARYFTGPFTNTGPIPPKAESNTSYSIVWTVKNSSNTIGNTSVSTVLPPYVSFLNAPQGSGITFDQGSRTVKWNIGDLKAGAGYTLPARQAAFQVLLSPSTSQVGSAPQLTSPVRLTGQDRFAQIGVEATAPAPTTFLNGESGFTNGMDIVAPK